IYSATGTDVNGCIGMTSVEITVNDCASISENTMTARIYPNPVQDKVSIQLSNSVVGTVELLDVTGAIISTQSIQGMSIEIDMTKLSKGAYLIRIVSPEFNTLERIVK